MRIRVFHNTDPLAQAFGYQPGAAVREVCTYSDATSSTADEALNQAFRLFNVGHDPDPRAVTYREQGHRSFSVGDVIEIDGNYYGCAALGWIAISTPRIVQASAHRQGAYDLDPSTRSDHLPAAGTDSP